MLAIFLNRCRSSTLDAETELGDEAPRTQHPKRIFAEALARISDRAHDFVLYVLLAVVRVNKLSFMNVQGDRVDGEVAASEVFEKGSAEGDRVRPGPCWGGGPRAGGGGGGRTT